jgi:predicted nucleic acid-binding protein
LDERDILKIYIDTSVYNRPFDDQAQPRIWLETLSLSIILQMISRDIVDLVISTVLDYENSGNPFVWRRNWVSHCIRSAKFKHTINIDIKIRALELENEGLKAMDALHVACGEHSDSEFFITCDDRIIKLYNGKKLRVINPVNFVLEFGGAFNDS